MTTQKVMAVVGAGVIGLSWARLARDHGWRVGISDPRPDLDAVVEAAFGADDSNVLCSKSMTDILGDADLVQENGPERLPIKHELFGEFLTAAPKHAVLATSSSSISASLIGDGLSDASRIIVGHPFNPPALMPLVEVVPGARTSESTVTTAVSLYRSTEADRRVVRNQCVGVAVDERNGYLY